MQGNQIVTYIPSFLPLEYRLARGTGRYVQVLLEPVTTTDATPTTVLSLPLVVGQGYFLKVFGEAIQSDGSNQYAFESINSFSRSAGGSARGGTALGTSQTIVNTFAVTRPSINWPNPTTNLAEFQIIGKAATTITWYLFAVYVNN